MAAYSYPVTFATGKRGTIDSDTPLDAAQLQAHLDAYNQQDEQETQAANARAQADAAEGRFGSYGGTAARSFIAPLASTTRGLGEMFDSPTLVRGGNELDERTATNFPANPQYAADPVGKVVGTTAGLGGAALPFLVPYAGEALGPASLIPQTYESGYRQALAAGAPVSEAQDYAKTHVAIQLPLMIGMGRVARSALLGDGAATVAPLRELGVGMTEAGGIGAASRLADNLQIGRYGYNLDPDRGVTDDVLSEGVQMGLGAGLLGLPRLAYHAALPTPPAAAPADSTATPVAPPAAPAISASAALGNRFGGMMDLADRARQAFGANAPAAGEGAGVPTVPDDASGVDVPTFQQPSFLPPLAGKSAADSGAFLADNTLTSSDLTNQLYRRDEQAASTAAAADQKVNFLARLRASVQAEADRQQASADKAKQDAQVVTAASTAAEVAANTEDVAPASAAALRQKASEKVAANTDVTPTPAPDAAAAVEPPTQLPPVEPPPPVDDQGKVASIAPDSQTPTPKPLDPPVPSADATPAQPSPEASASAATTPPESTVGDAAPTATPATPDPQSVPPASEAASQAEGETPEKAAASLHPDVQVPGPSAEANSADPNAQAPRLDSRGKPITVIDSDPTEAMRASGDVQGDAETVDDLTGGVRPDDKVTEVAPKSEAYGSRVNDDHFALPQETDAYTADTVKLPPAPNEAENMVKANDVVQKRRYEVQNKVGGYESRGGTDATERVLGAALLKYQRNLREGISGKDGFKPNEVGQVLNNVIRDFQKGASKRRVNTALDAPVGSEGSASVGDLVPDTDAVNPAEHAALSEEAGLLQNAQDSYLKSLPDKGTRARVEKLLEKVKGGYDPENFSDADYELWEGFQDHAKDYFENPSAREPAGGERPASERAGGAQGDAAPKDEATGGAREDAREHGAGTSGPGDEEVAPARSEVAPDREQPSPDVPEGEGKREYQAGDRVRFKKRAAVVKRIDGDTATIQLKGSKRSVKVPTSDLNDPIQRSFIMPGAPNGTRDIIDEILENEGMLSPRKYRAKVASGELQPGGEYDSAPGAGEIDQLPGIYHNLIFGGRMTPDKMATAIAPYGEGQPGFGDGTPDTMFNEIQKAITARQNSRRNATADAKEVAQVDRFEKDSTTPTKARSEEVVGKMLNVGDEVTIGGAKLKVIKVDPDSGDVTLQDGSRYGRQVVGADQELYVEKVDHIQRPEADDWLGDEHEPEPESAPARPGAEIDDKAEMFGGDDPRTAPEEVAKRERMAQMQERQGERLTAGDIDTTGDMFDPEKEENPLFSARQPAPRTNDLLPEHNQALDTALDQNRTALERLGVKIQERDDGKAARGMAAAYDAKGNVTFEVDRNALAKNLSVLSPEDATSFIQHGVAEEVIHATDLSNEQEQWQKAGRPGDFDDFVQHTKTALLNDIYGDLDDASTPKVRATLEGALLDGWNLYRDPNGDAKVSLAEAKARAAEGKLDFSFKNTDDLMQFLNDNPERVASYMLETLRQLVQLRADNPSLTTETSYVSLLARFRDFIDQLLNRLRTVAADPKAFSPALADAISRIEAARRGENDIPPPGEGGSGDGVQRVDAPVPKPPRAPYDAERDFIKTVTGIDAPKPTDKAPDLPSARERITAAAADAKESGGRLAAAVKELGALKPLSDKDVALRDLSYKKQINDFYADRVTEGFRQAVPDKSAREAITVYRDLGGDTAKLRDAASKATDSSARERYERALNLSPDEKKVADALGKFYAAKLDEGQAAGILGEGRENYINRIVKRPFFELAAPDRAPGGAGSGSRFSKRFRFADERTFPTVPDVEAAGHTLQTYDSAELAGIYAHELGRAKMTREFADNLKVAQASDGRPLAAARAEAPNLRPGASPAEIEAAIKADRSDYVPNEKLGILGSLALHPEAARDVSNVLGNSSISQWLNEASSNPFAALGKSTLRGFQKLQSITKATMFDLSPFHMVTEGVHATGHRINPFGATEKFDPSNPAHQEAARAGLMLVPDVSGVNHFAEGLAGSGDSLVQKIPGVGKFAKGMSDFLFHSYIPSLKLKTFAAAMERNMARFKPMLDAGKYTRQDVAALTADQVNAGYGHLNYIALARNPTMQHVFRLAALAPDFLEARLRFSGQAASGIAGKVGREQLGAIATLFGSQFILARLWNKNMDDDFHWDHPFDLVYKGRSYTLRSVPEDIYKAVTDTGKFLSGRESPAVRTGIQLLTGRNYRGERTTAPETLKEAATSAIPISLRELPGLNKLSETQRNSTVKWWESAISAMGVHIGRVSPETDVYAAANKFKAAKGIKEDTGVYPTGPLTPIKYALQDGDVDKARAGIQSLIDAGKTRFQVLQSLHASILHPYTGSQAMDREFSTNLTGADRAAFVAAQKQRGKMLALAREVIAELPAKPPKP